jgi:hypothetical protein
MGFRFICPSTGQKLEANCEVDEDLMLRTENIATQCSFFGGSHEWVFVGSTQPRPSPSDRASIGNTLPWKKLGPRRSS